MRRRYRIARAPREPIPSVALFARYVPLLAGTRKRRAVLLEEFRVTGNPRCISEIELQAIQDIPMVEALAAIFGKGRANFRTFMAWEATRKPEIKAEMNGFIAEAKDNPVELRRWRKAKVAVRRFEDGGPWNKIRARQSYGRSRCCSTTDGFPSQGHGQRLSAQDRVQGPCHEKWKVGTAIFLRTCSAQMPQTETGRADLMTKTLGVSRHEITLASGIFMTMLLG